MSSDTPTVIYPGMGPYFPALAWGVGRFEGWLMMRHPDGNWVSVADLRALAELRAERDRLAAKVERLREALGSIINHQRIISGGHLTIADQIARRALDKE